MSEDIAIRLAQRKAELLDRLKSSSKEESSQPQPVLDPHKHDGVPPENVSSHPLSVPESALPEDPDQNILTQKRRKKRRARQDKAKEEEQQVKEMEARREKLSQERRLEYLTTIHVHEKQQQQELLQQSKQAHSAIAQAIIQHTKDVVAKTAKNAKVTRRERKDQERVSLAELKILAQFPGLIEQHDNTAPDPFFLVYLKCYPSVIPVSMHWSQKRRLLANKHGSEKSTFVVPQYIEQLNARILVEKDDKTLRQELRDRARAHMHRHNIDYQDWENAFYIHMPQVRYEKLENSYYELKELDDQYKHYSPLNPLSSELLRALGMSSSREDGPPVTLPPPWLENMAIHGPPPSYPNLYIPGINAPLPYGATWGGDPSATTSSRSEGWGNPPIKTTTITDPTTGIPISVGQPLWDGDLYGQSYYIQQLHQQQRTMDEQHRSHSSSTASIPQTGDQGAQVLSIAGAWLNTQTLPPQSSSLTIPFFEAQQQLGKDALLNRQNQSFIRQPHNLSLFGVLDYTELDRKIEEKFLQEALESQAQSDESTHPSDAQPDEEHTKSRHSIQTINEARLKALPQEHREDFIRRYHNDPSSQLPPDDATPKELYTVLPPNPTS